MLEHIHSYLREFFTWLGLKSFWACFMSFALAAVGYPGSAFILLLCLMGVDFILGFTRAWSEKLLSREKFMRGTLKLLFYWVSVALMVVIDRSLERAFRGNMPYALHDFFIAYLAIGECLSCADHMAFWGFSFPEPFLRRLKKYRKKIEDGE